MSKNRELKIEKMQKSMHEGKMNEKNGMRRWKQPSNTNVQNDENDWMVVNMSTPYGNENFFGFSHSNYCRFDSLSFPLSDPNNLTVLYEREKYVYIHRSTIHI